MDGQGVVQQVIAAYVPESAMNISIGQLHLEECSPQIREIFRHLATDSRLETIEEFKSLFGDGYSDIQVEISYGPKHDNKEMTLLRYAVERRNLAAFLVILDARQKQILMSGIQLDELHPFDQLIQSYNQLLSKTREDEREITLNLNGVLGDYQTTYDHVSYLQFKMVLNRCLKRGLNSDDDAQMNSFRVTTLL